MGDVVYFESLKLIWDRVLKKGLQVFVLKIYIVDVYPSERWQNQGTHLFYEIYIVFLE